jgi:hypothetical protein
MEGFFVLGFVLTTTPVPGPSSPRFPFSLIWARANDARLPPTECWPIPSIRSLSAALHGVWYRQKFSCSKHP